MQGTGWRGRFNFNGGFDIKYYYERLHLKAVVLGKEILVLDIIIVLADIDLVLLSINLYRNIQHATLIVTHTETKNEITDQTFSSLSNM